MTFGVMSMFTLFVEGILIANTYLLRTYYMLGTLPSTLYGLIHLILTTTL